MYQPPCESISKRLFIGFLIGSPNVTISTGSNSSFSDVDIHLSAAETVREEHQAAINENGIHYPGLVRTSCRSPRYRVAKVASQLAR